MKGFTIVETLVAISILLIALAGPLTIAANGLQSSLYSRDQTTAFYLAQEGIEYLRNMRDTNDLAGEPWDTNFTNCISTTDPNEYNYCRIDATVDYVPGTFGDDPTVVTCSGQMCPPLNVDPTTNLYQYTSGSPSKFTRTITMTPIMSDAGGAVSEYKITSSVTWTGPLPNSSVTLSEDIFNWQNN